MHHTSALRVRALSGPLKKDAKVAIVGAGAAGLSAGLELKRLGYASVTIFEQAKEVGGKSYTVKFNGRLHDMGATMGIKLMYSNIEKLASQFGQKTTRFPRRVFYDLTTGGQAEPRTVT